MIYQAGVDYETRPMVVLNASALPDPRDVDYDVLLSRILSYLDLYGLSSHLIEATIGLTLILNSGV